MKDRGSFLVFGFLSDFFRGPAERARQISGPAARLPRHRHKLTEFIPYRAILTLTEILQRAGIKLILQARWVKVKPANLRFTDFGKKLCEKKGLKTYPTIRMSVSVGT